MDVRNSQYGLVRRFTWQQQPGVSIFWTHKTGLRLLPERHLFDFRLHRGPFLEWTIDGTGQVLDGNLSQIGELLE